MSNLYYLVLKLIFLPDFRIRIYEAGKIVASENKLPVESKLLAWKYRPHRLSIVTGTRNKGRWELVFKVIDESYRNLLIQNFGPENEPKIDAMKLMSNLLKNECTDNKDEVENDGLENDEKLNPGIAYLIENSTNQLVIDEFDACEPEQIFLLAESISNLQKWYHFDKVNGKVFNSYVAALKKQGFQVKRTDNTAMMVTVTKNVNSISRFMFQFFKNLTSKFIRSKMKKYFWQWQMEAAVYDYCNNAWK